MNLNPAQCERFYRLWLLLLQHVNAQEQLIPTLPTVFKQGELAVKDAQILRNALWTSNDHLDSFLLAQQDRLPEADLELIASWRQRVSGNFYILRHLKKGSIFLSERAPSYAYCVLGIVSPIASVIDWPLPILTQATLIPFEDKIIYDSLLTPYSITFGGGIQKSLNNDFRNTQEHHGVITTLPFNVAKQGAAITAGHRKIIRAFCKALAAARLSNKMLQHHGSNLEAFAAYLENRLPPRSLLDIDVDDIENYWTQASTPIDPISFKRFIKFMLNSDRMDFQTAEMIKDFLKQQ